GTSRLAFVWTASKPSRRAKSRCVVRMGGRGAGNGKPLDRPRGGPARHVRESRGAGAVWVAALAGSKVSTIRAGKRSNRTESWSSGRRLGTRPWSCPRLEEGDCHEPSRRFDRRLGDG